MFRLLRMLAMHIALAGTRFAVKSSFGTVGNQIMRSYTADEVIPAGVAVMAGAKANSVKLATGANVRAIGVSADAAAAAGDPVPVILFGEVIAIADAAVAREDYVMTNAATGQLAPIGAVGGTNYHVVGIAKEAAAAQGDEFLLLVAPSRAQG